MKIKQLLTHDKEWLREVAKYLLNDPDAQKYYRIASGPIIEELASFFWKKLWEQSRKDFLELTFEDGENSREIVVYGNLRNDYFIYCLIDTEATVKYFPKIEEVINYLKEFIDEQTV